MCDRTHAKNTHFTSRRCAAGFDEDHRYLRVMLHTISLAPLMQVSSELLTSQVRAYVLAWSLRTTTQKSSIRLLHVSMYRVQAYISNSLQRNLLAVPLANFNRALHSLTKLDAKSKSLKNLRAKFWPEVTHLNTIWGNGARLHPPRTQTKPPNSSHNTLMSTRMTSHFQPSHSCTRQQWMPQQLEGMACRRPWFKQRLC